MVMKNTSCNSTVCSKLNLHAAPPQLLEASIAVCCAAGTIMSDVLWRTNNALNLSLSHTNGNSGQLVSRNRMGKYEEAQKT
jgi:hypothetical protein